MGFYTPLRLPRLIEFIWAIVENISQLQEVCHVIYNL